MARSAIQRLGSDWGFRILLPFQIIPNFHFMHLSLYPANPPKSMMPAHHPQTWKASCLLMLNLTKHAFGDSDTVPLRALSHEIKLRPKVVLSKLRAQIRPSRRTRTHSSGRNEGSTWKRAKNTEKKHETVSLLKATVNEETSISIAGRRVLLSEAFWKLLLSDDRKSQVWGLQLTR